MTLITGTIKQGVPSRIIHNQLNQELEAVGAGIGWAVEWDANKNPIAIRYEFDDSDGLSRKQIEEVLRAHTVAPGTDDDKEASVKVEAQEAEVKQESARIAAQFKNLEARVAALEAARK